MWTLFTLLFAACKAELIFGNIPPAIDPFLISLLICLDFNPVMSFFSLSKTPLVFVSRISFSALIATANFPATTSAFTLYFFLSLSPKPIDDITGMMSFFMEFFIF